MVGPARMEVGVGLEWEALRYSRLGEVAHITGNGPQKRGPKGYWMLGNGGETRVCSLLSGGFCRKDELDRQTADTCDKVL